MRPVGVFGGMFDPIHYGHLRAAQELRELIGLESVAFVPAGDPPQTLNCAYHETRSARPQEGSYTLVRQPAQ